MNLKWLKIETSDKYNVVIHPDRVPRGEHERRFNTPNTNEIAAVVFSSEQTVSRDIVIQAHDGRLSSVLDTHIDFMMLSIFSGHVRQSGDLKRQNLLLLCFERSGGHRREHVNTQNTGIWSLENPHEVLESQKDSPKLDVFCAVCWRIMYEPFVFGEPTVTGSAYLDALQLWPFPQMKESGPDNFIWQQDDALRKKGDMNNGPYHFELRSSDEDYSGVLAHHSPELPHYRNACSTGATDYGPRNFGPQSRNEDDKSTGIQLSKLLHHTNVIPRILRTYANRNFTNHCSWFQANADSLRNVLTCSSYDEGGVVKVISTSNGLVI
ncbi:uncharacterized protein TNCV_4549221 [Trichonephila clavipes]|nr:uncharacterized protein TNCV_4549221 [Trichonephila clavipes]